MKIKTILFSIFSIAFLFSISYAQTLPENPLAGRIVFEEKGCINCHSINGVGNHVGPDFGEHLFFGTGYKLAAYMWDHSYKMVPKMKELGVKRPVFTGNEFKKLQTYLYFVRYLGENGDIAKGKELFAQKGCNICHSIGNKNSVGIRLDRMKVYPSPLYLAQNLWNHSPLIHEKIRSMGITIPTLTSSNIVNLAAYLQAVNYFSKREKQYFYPGNPEKGEELFKKKHCYYCHILTGTGPNLKKLTMNKSVTEIAGMMWNHSDFMQRKAMELDIKWPTFHGNEMADIISYLYYINPPHVSGSEGDGRLLFKTKGCINCHFAGNKMHAPVFTEKKYYGSKNEFFASIWNHIPRTEAAFLLKGKRLPDLTASDVKSLYLFLKR